MHQVKLLIIVIYVAIGVQMDPVIDAFHDL